MGTILYGEVVDHNLTNTTFYNDLLCNIFECGEHGKASNIIIFHNLYRRHPQIVSVMLLMLFIVLCLGLFLGFHLFITSQNMTTNEYYKWKKLAKLYNNYSQGHMPALNDSVSSISLQKSRTNQSNISDLDEDVGCLGPTEERTQSSVQIAGQMPTNIYK